MRRLIHLVLSPTSRLVRLILGEKRIAIDPVHPEDPLAHLPVLRELDGTVITGLWAIIDHLENEHPERPLLPDDPLQRAEAASQANFRKPAAKLSALEAARLATILPNPKGYRADKPGPYVARQSTIIAARIGQVIRDRLDACVYR